MELKTKLAEMKLTSRWLADSALCTYFGKPPFHAYGNGNTNPTVGGGVYGQYMKSHNINPHAGGNRPQYSQVHERALLGGTVQTRGPSTKSPSKVNRNSGQYVSKEQFLAKSAKQKGKPVKMKRQPIPPRVARGKYEKGEAAQKAAEMKRLPVSA